MDHSIRLKLTGESAGLPLRCHLVSFACNAPIRSSPLFGQREMVWPIGAREAIEVSRAVVTYSVRYLSSRRLKQPGVRHQRCCEVPLG
jgi:hypothetical protein